IPEQNIAILDEDLTIPAGKTLDVKGDMSTENFDEVMDGSMSYVQENTAYGNLTNYGTVLIKGNLFTSNQQMVITDTTVADHEDKMSSTIISSGKMVVSGKMTIFYSTYNQQTNPNTDYSGFSGLDCSDLTITSNGIVEINGLNGSLNHGVNFTPDSIAGMTGEQFNNSDQTILRKAADADSTGSFKLKFEHFYNNTEEHFRVQILDSTETYTGIIYDEH
nr:hypothetical protein [Lachnospiraceae bacterium]